MSMPYPPEQDGTVEQDGTAEQENSGEPVLGVDLDAPAPPLTIRTQRGRWGLFDKVRFRWGGFGDILLGIAMIGGGGSAAAAVFGVLFIALGIATWVLTGFGGAGGTDPVNWYTAWHGMSTPRRAVAGTGVVIGLLFVYAIFFWFFILKMVWRHIVAPSM